MQRSAGRVHEELRRTDLQVRVQDVHEILQEIVLIRHPRPEVAMRKLANILAAAALGTTSFVTDATGEKLQKLSGAQIRAKFWLIRACPAPAPGNRNRS